MPSTPPTKSPAGAAHGQALELPDTDVDEEDVLGLTEAEEDVLEEFERSQRREAGLSEDAPPGHGPDKDDADLEDLIHEDGARSPFEEGGALAADEDLSIVDELTPDEGLSDDIKESELPHHRPETGA